ncbi:MAG: hypothetical protein AAF085_01950 [Planctomycetota bacterium]
MATGKHDAVLLLYFWIFAIIPLIAMCMASTACLSACRREPSYRAALITLLLLVFNLSLLLNWPARGMFLFTRNALNQHAQQTLQAPSQQTQPKRIGIFHISETSTRPMPSGASTVTLKINGGSGPDYLVYGMTDTEIEKQFNLWSYQRLDHNWHLVHED